MEKIFEFKGSGTIVYNPARPGLKKKPDWWCIVELSGDTTRYYRWWVEKELGIKLNKPSWGDHISVIRGEKPWPDQMHLWDKYAGLEVEFDYSMNVRQSGVFWFIDVNCSTLINIREELNLPCNYGLHLSVGRIA